MATPWHEMSALGLGDQIARGAVDPVALAEHFLTRIEALDGGHEIYLRTTPERALAEARAARERARSGSRLGRLDGVPISWKDLFDSAGVVTSGGTPLLGDRVPEHDAETLRRATGAGLVCLGKTNTPEFAYSGLGINPHYGTPANPFGRDEPLAPGGSSSGAAVSVARGLAALGIGSDTGGSVRIPAAWNGLVGLKTTVGVVPTTGVLPLSRTFDTVGPLCRDVADANAMFAILAGREPADLSDARLEGTRLLKPATLLWEALDEAVARATAGALDALRRAGAEVIEDAVPEFDECVDLVARRGNIISAEGYAIWRHLIEAHPDRIDAGILARLRQALEHSAADIAEVYMGLPAISVRYLERTAAYDAVVAPTIPIPPPSLARLARDQDYQAEAYLSTVRNTRVGNQLGLCALTLPCPVGANELPVGLMLMAAPRREAALLRLGHAAERTLSERRV